MKKIHTGDKVVVLSGKDKGKNGVITKIMTRERVIVEGINLLKKHTKPNPAQGISGGIIEREFSIHISKVALLDSSLQKASKVGVKHYEDGKKKRFLKLNNEVV